MAQDIIDQAALIQAGAFLARSTYGAEYISRKFWVDGDGEAEKKDDYRGYVDGTAGWKLLDASDLPDFNDRGGDAGFTKNGLYDARVIGIVRASFDAQGLLAVKDGNTLVLAFRGTDGEDPAVESGQAWTGLGLAQQYKAFRPLIEAALDYVASHDEITDVVVSGHSLGGALADVFAIRDADRFEQLRPDHVTVVSLGSSGIPRSLPVFLDGIDQERVTMDGGPIPSIVKLLAPDGYFSFANTQDRAHFPDSYPNVPETPGLVPILTLKGNLQFGEDTLFRVPNIKNTDVIYYPPKEHPFDFRGMGAEHSSALLWANIQALTHDELFSRYRDQKLTMGNTDYTQLPDDDGTNISLFKGLLFLHDKSMTNDRGSRTLVGGNGQDYIMGLDGKDSLEGRGGDDLLSGGLGQDILTGGTDDDTLAGGAGADRLRGNAGHDTFVFTDVSQSQGVQFDVILDFRNGVDVIDVTAVDADSTEDGLQHFQFVGTADFSGAAQIRAEQDGGNTVLKFNTDGDNQAEMTVLLKQVNAASLADDAFILFFEL